MKIFSVIAVFLCIFICGTLTTPAVAGEDNSCTGQCIYRDQEVEVSEIHEGLYSIRALKFMWNRNASSPVFGCEENINHGLRILYDKVIKGKEYKISERFTGELVDTNVIYAIWVEVPGAGKIR